MPRGMEVFDSDEHIGYDGSAEGDSTGLSAKAGSGRNSGGQKYKGHANGPKKVPAQRDQPKYYAYDARRAFKHDKLTLEDLTDDEDYLSVDEGGTGTSKGRGKGK